MTCLGVLETDDNYWLTSRYSQRRTINNDTAEELFFEMRYVDCEEINGVSENYVIWTNSYGSNSATSGSDGYAVRPVVKIRLD